jgi:hypothetical protein
MISEFGSEIFVGIFTLDAAAVGNYFQYKTQKFAEKSKNKRASADYILQKEAEALMELLENAEKCQYYSNKYANAASGQGEVTDEFAKEANYALDEFQASMRTKTVFLDEEDKETVNNMYGSVRAAMVSGDRHRTGRSDLAHETIDWKELKDNFEELREVLEQNLKGRIEEIRE